MAEPTSGNGGRRADPERGATVVTRLSRPSRAALLLVLVVAALFALRQVASPDTGFHLRAGNHILDGHGWPDTDPFTYTLTDRPYVDTSWGFQVVLALVERGFGSRGMVLFATTLVLAVFLLLLLTARLVPAGSRVLPLLLLIAALATETRFDVRPELLSYALLALVLYLLHRHAEGLRSPLWLVPVIFLVWANSHALFILGLGALACFVVGQTLRRRRVDRQLSTWAAVSLLVTLVNPYGWRALTFPFTLATRMQESNVFSRTIGEFGSPLHYARSDQLMFYLPSVVCTFALIALVLLSIRPLFRQKRYGCLLLCVTFLPLALIMIRNVPPLMIACLPGVAWGLSLDRAMDLVGMRGRPRRWVGMAVLGAVLVYAPILALRIATDAFYIKGRRLDRFGSSWNRLTQPLGAAEYANRAGLDGKVLNHLNFGGYLMWARPEPVFIDGRLEVVGETFYQEYRRAFESKAGLEATVSRYGIDWVIFPLRLVPQLLRELSRDPAWRLAYVDHIAVVFVRQHDGVESILDESARLADSATSAPVDVESLPGLGGAPLPGRLGRWLSGLFRRQSYPTGAFNRATFHFYRAEGDQAIRYYAEAIEQSGGAYYEIYNNLGSALYAMDRLREARECYALVLREMPPYRAERRRRVAERLEEIDRIIGPGAP